MKKQTIRETETGSYEPGKKFWHCIVEEMPKNPRAKLEMETSAEEGSGIFGTDMEDAVDYIASIPNGPEYSAFTLNSDQRKEYPIVTGCLRYFPDAIRAVSRQGVPTIKTSVLDTLMVELMWGNSLNVASLALYNLQASITGTPPATTAGDLYIWCCEYAEALAALSKLSKEGNDKHNPGEPLHWSREKSNDHKDCVGRHALDGDWVELAWRALAQEQIELEDELDPF